MNTNEISNDDKILISSMIINLFDINSDIDNTINTLNSFIDNILEKNKDLTIDNLFEEINNSNNQLLKLKVEEHFNNSKLFGHYDYSYASYFKS